MRLILPCWLLLSAMLCLVQSSGRAEAAGATAEIVIRERNFSPPVLTLPLREPVTLVIRNEDNDLHAFVPLLLLQSTNVQVSGNGAPEFNETGFARILIPPHGRAELTFRPKVAGQFFYICDLPGHQMRAQINVDASLDGHPQHR